MGYMKPMEISMEYMYPMEITTVISMGYMYPMEISMGYMYPRGVDLGIGKSHIAELTHSQLQPPGPHALAPGSWVLRLRRLSWLPRRWW